MSHNITVKEKCTIAQVQNVCVQNILKKMGWKILPAGDVKSDAINEPPVRAEIRIAIPVSQMPTQFGHKIHKGSEEAIEHNIKSEETHVVIGINATEITEENPNGGVTIVGDGYKRGHNPDAISNVEDATKKIKQAVCVGIAISKIRKFAGNSAYESLISKTGATNNIAQVGSMEDDAADHIKSGQGGTIKFKPFTTKQTQIQ